MAEDYEELGFPPLHPGARIRDVILPALGMSVKDLAEHLGVTRPTLSAFLNGKSSLSLEMAHRLGQAFGNGARFWLALQMRYDVWEIEHSGDRIRVERLNWPDDKGDEAA